MAFVGVGHFCLGLSRHDKLFQLCNRALEFLRGLLCTSLGVSACFRDAASSSLKLLAALENAGLQIWCTQYHV